MPHIQDPGRPVHIGVLYVETLPEDLFSDFLSEVQHEGLEVVSESYEQKVYSGMEWLLPTAAWASPSSPDGCISPLSFQTGLG